MVLRKSLLSGIQAPENQFGVSVLSGWLFRNRFCSNISSTSNDEYGRCRLTS